MTKGKAIFGLDEESRLVRLSAEFSQIIGEARITAREFRSARKDARIALRFLREARNWKRIGGDWVGVDGYLAVARQHAAVMRTIAVNEMLAKEGRESRALRARAARSAQGRDSVEHARYQATRLRGRNRELSTTDIAKKLAPDFGVSVRTMQRWLR